MVEDAVPGGGINPGSGGSGPGNLTDVNGTLFFEADDGSNGTELWKAAIEGPAPPPPPPPPPPTGSTDSGSQTGTIGPTETAGPRCQPLRKKLKRAKTRAAKKKIRHKLRALGC